MPVGARILRSGVPPPAIAGPTDEVGLEAIPPGLLVGAQALAGLIVAAACL